MNQRSKKVVMQENGSRRECGDYCEARRENHIPMIQHPSKFIRNPAGAIE